MPTGDATSLGTSSGTRASKKTKKPKADKVSRNLRIFYEAFKDAPQAVPLKTFGDIFAEKGFLTDTPLNLSGHKTKVADAPFAVVMNIMHDIAEQGEFELQEVNDRFIKTRREDMFQVVAGSCPNLLKKEDDKS